jgi:hypothetical protein
MSLADRNEARSRVRNPGEHRRPGIVAAVLVLICCAAIPLLLLSGVSLAFLAPYWPLAGVALALLGIIAFIWYVKRGWPKGPRNGPRA